MTVFTMFLVLCGISWPAQGSRARVPPEESLNAAHENALNPKNIANSNRTLKWFAIGEDSRLTGHRRRRWKLGQVGKWSIPAFMAATYLGSYLPGVGNLTEDIVQRFRRRLDLDNEWRSISKGTIDGAASPFPSRSSHSRLWAGRAAYVNNDIAFTSRMALGNAANVLESNIPKILANDPNWNVFAEYSKSTDGDLILPAPPMQHEKQQVLQTVASLPDVFAKQAKVAIGVWAVFGQPGALRALRDSAQEDMHKIEGQEAFQEARAIVHGFGETVVKMAAATLFLPHIYKFTVDRIKQINEHQEFQFFSSEVPPGPPPQVYYYHAAQAKGALLDWSQRLGDVISDKVGVDDFLDDGLAEWPHLPPLTWYAGIVVGLYSAPATKRLRGLLAKSPGLVLSVLKEDAASAGRALADVGKAGKNFLKDLRAQQKRLKDDTGVLDLIGLTM